MIASFDELHGFYYEYEGILSTNLFYCITTHYLHFLGWYSYSFSRFIFMKF
jgi:hypothetical protein